MLALSILSLLFLSLPTPTISTGAFLTPSGPDGSLRLQTGDTIDIAWTNTSDYSILSLGYYSSSNYTITWLISNSQSNPTSYRWTVDAAAQGFNLTDSDLFSFYICKDLNFGDPFQSSYVVIQDPQQSSGATTTTTGTGTSTSTSLTTSLPTLVTPTNAPATTTGAASGADATGASARSGGSTSGASGLSSGAIAGIAVGVVVGVLGFVAAAFMFFRMRRRGAGVTGRVLPPKEVVEAPHSGGAGSAYARDQKVDGMYTALHEAAADQREARRPVEIGSGRDDGDGRVELPVGR